MMYFFQIHDPIRERTDVPVVRLESVEMWNFKNTGHTKVRLFADDPEKTDGTGTNILALYGQNGSGKTALIHALSLFRTLLCADEVTEEYGDCIDVKAPCAALTYTLTMQYPDTTPRGLYKNGAGRFGAAGDVFTVIYKVRLLRVRPSQEEPPFRIFGEELLVEGTVQGKPFERQTVLDSTNTVLGPQSTVRSLFGDRQPPAEVLLPLPWYDDCNYSFLFFCAQSYASQIKSASPYLGLLMDLHSFAKFHLVVVNTTSDGLVRQNLFLPLYTDTNLINLSMNRPNLIDPLSVDYINTYINAVSTVTEAVVPGLRIKLSDKGPATDREGRIKRRMTLVSVREGRELPLRCESDGVRHILSMLWCLTWAYNDPHVTLAVDELDAGVFEFLLGELLQVFKDGGRGQLLFTAHNLRPLEVLDSESIIFTTTDPKDRYRKLTGFGEGENLRRAYYREILLNEHFDDLYAPTTRYRIAMAMESAMETGTDSAKKEGR